MKRTELTPQCWQVSGPGYTGKAVILVSGQNSKCWYLDGVNRAVIVWRDRRQDQQTKLWTLINRTVKSEMSEKEVLQKIAHESEVEIIWRAA